MKIRLYTITFNEFDILPYTLLHYSHVVDSMVFYDNGSSDGTLEYLHRLARVNPHMEIRHYDTGGSLSDNSITALYNEAWKECKAMDIDWVIFCAADEFLHIPNGLSRGFFQWLEDQGYDALHAQGFQMFSEENIPQVLLEGHHLHHDPKDPYPPLSIDGEIALDLPSLIQDGFPCHWYDKTIAFNVRRIKEMNWEVGCHECKPIRCDMETPRIFQDDFSNVKLLHYKFIGGMSRQESRRQERAGRLSRMNIEMGWGTQLLDPSVYYKDYQEAKERSTRIL